MKKHSPQAAWNWLSYSALEEAIENLRSNITIEAISKSNVIEIGYTHQEPAKAAKIANALANAYADYTDKVHGGEEFGNFLQERIQSTKTQLDSLESALQAFRVSHDMVSYNKQESMLLDKFKSFDQQLSGKRESIAVLEKKDSCVCAS